MKVELHSFLDASNGLELVLLPDTPIEQALLKALGRHGIMRYADRELRIQWPVEAGTKPNDLG